MKMSYFFNIIYINFTTSYNNFLSLLDNILIDAIVGVCVCVCIFYIYIYIHAHTEIYQNIYR